jgi:hypothetical protein
MGERLQVAWVCGKNFARRRWLLTGSPKRHNGDSGREIPRAKFQEPKIQARKAANFTFGPLVLGSSVLGI